MFLYVVNIYSTIDVTKNIAYSCRIYVYFKISAWIWHIANWLQLEVNCSLILYTLINLNFEFKDFLNIIIFISPSKKKNFIIIDNRRHSFDCEIKLIIKLDPSILTLNINFHVTNPCTISFITSYDNNVIRSKDSKGRLSFIFEWCYSFLHKHKLYPFIWLKRESLTLVKNSNLISSYFSATNNIQITAFYDDRKSISCSFHWL